MAVCWPSGQTCSPILGQPKGGSADDAWVAELGGDVETVKIQAREPVKGLTLEFQCLIGKAEGVDGLRVEPHQVILPALQGPAGCSSPRYFEGDGKGPTGCAAASSLRARIRRGANLH